MKPCSSQPHALRMLFVATAVWLAFAAEATHAQQPNIVIVNIDDMGWNDFAVYGSNYAQTPNIDQLAAQGTRFTQFYASAPICSPSRAGLFTGQYAARSGINSFLNDSSSNLARDNADSLSLDAPSIARTFHDAGYATGHFGKWHLGGGRDVGYAVNPTPGTNVAAPRVVEYGYDDAWTQFEGLGNRIINVVDYGGDAAGVATRPSAYFNGLNQQSDARGTSGGLDQIVYLEREFNATFMVDRAIDFINDTKTADPSKPFFMNVWLDEVHTPHDPPPALRAKYNALYPGLPAASRDYLAVLEHTDAQIGRLVDYIDQQGLGEETLILVMSDNGPTAGNGNNIGSSGPFRGSKGDLFEGGFRQPLIARWTGSVEQNRVDADTVMWMPDLFPTLLDVAGVDVPQGATFDGESLPDALLGNSTQSRSTPLFWNMNRGTEDRHVNPDPTGAGAGGQEVIAIRSGNWKLLLNARGTAPELYDLAADPGEETNLALNEPQVVRQLASEALAIRYSTPSRTLPDAVTPLVRLKADALAALGNGASVSMWTDMASGDSFNGSVVQADAASRPTLVTGALNGRAVVQFDGGDSMFSSTTNALPAPGQGITVFAVTTADTSGATAERLAQIGDSSGAPGEVVGLDVSSTSTATNNGGAGFRFNNGSSLYDTPLSDSGFHIVVWQADHEQSYADATLFVDGTLPSHTFSGSGSGANHTSFTGNDLELILGTGRNASGAPLANDLFTGELAEFLVFNEQLSIGQINLVANYLSSEYDLPFAYRTDFDLFAAPGGLSWIGGASNFDAAWNKGDGAGGPTGAHSDPFLDGTQDLFLGNGGVAQFNDLTDTSSGSSINTLRIGTARGALIVAGTAGNGTLVASGSKSLTIGNGLAPAGGAETGDLTIGEGGHTGTLHWNSTGTLKVEGRLRVGEGGTGIMIQDDGVVTAGDVAGSLKFMAIGSGAGSSGIYHLNQGRLLLGGGLQGSELRHLRIGFNGATGALTVGDGAGAANSASVESPDDLYVGFDGGDGLLTIASDGRILLQGDNAPVFIGHNAGSMGSVLQNGGTFDSDGQFTIGSNGGVGTYEIRGGELRLANDGNAALRIGVSGGKGTLRLAGTAVVEHGDRLRLGDASPDTEARLELVGSSGSLTTRVLQNLAGASETIQWVADAAGVTPIVVNGASGAVQLQNSSEVAGNISIGGQLLGDGTALELDLSSLSGDHTLTLIDNQTPGPVLGFFEKGSTNELYTEGALIEGTGFSGSVTITYFGGANGNSVLLHLEAAALAGDYNEDGVVDAADYVVWRRTGIHGAQGYDDWRGNFGATLAGAAGGVSVPEPGTLTTLVLGALAASLGRTLRCGAGDGREEGGVEK